MRSAIFKIILVAAGLFLSGCGSGINVDKLSDSDRSMVQRITDRLESMIEQRRGRGDIAALTLGELYQPLDAEEKAFMQRFRRMDTKYLKLTIPYQRVADKTPDLVIIRGQVMNLPDGTEQEIPPQFLPRNVYIAYTDMIMEMKKTIGKTLYVESGYRSAAYQFYLFVFYLKDHNYSIRETAKSVAWPGYSEHGQLARQAIDFVNEQGIDGQNDPAAFEALEEYQWLLQNAEKHGFRLSYPRGSTMTFEPWHWHYHPAQ